jgi:hypothetical protein
MWAQKGWLSTVSFHIARGRIHKNLLAEEWADQSWKAMPKPTGGGAGATVMYNSCHMCKQPLMWTVINVVHILARSTNEIGPSFRDDSPHTNELHGIKDGRQYLRNILKHNTSKADVYGRRPCL